LWGLLLLALWRVAADPFEVNRRLWSTVPYNAGAEDVLRWLRQRDAGAFFLHNSEDAIGGYANVPQLKYGAQVLNSSWVLKPRLTATAGAPDGGQFTPTPKYVITRRDAATGPGAVPLYSAPGGVITAGPPGLPFAFVADPQRLPYGPEAGETALATGQVAEAPARFDGPNRLVVQVPPGAPARFSTLVVLQSGFDGWRARSASGAAPPVGVTGGFLSLGGVRPGETYVLTYRPPSFTAGAALSVLGLVAVALLLLLEWRGAAGTWLRRWPPPADPSGRPPRGIRDAVPAEAAAPARGS
jgi:hypothetical protein